MPTAYKLNPISGIKNLLIGLWVTLRHLFSKSITLQYPTERWDNARTLARRRRALSDKETGDLNCTACMLCAKACPTGSDPHRTPSRRRQDAGNSIYSRSTTQFAVICGLCEEACNFAAIKLTPKYEFSSYDKASLTYDVHRLQELGRDVDYVPTAKKAAPKPVAAAPVGDAAASVAPPAPPAESVPAVAPVPAKPVEPKGEGE